MRIKLNLKSNFTLVPEGERVLTITNAECTPSGKPNKLKVTFQDKDGGFVNSVYDFANSKGLFAMGKLLEVALKMEDGDDFDTTTDTRKLIGKKLLCKVEHSEGSKLNDNGEPTIFANVKRVMELVEDEDVSPRNSISYDLD